MIQYILQNMGDKWLNIIESHIKISKQQTYKYVSTKYGKTGKQAEK